MACNDDTREAEFVGLLGPSTEDVSARTPGHAMRADPDLLRFGMVLGKALGEHTGKGRAVIPVLVNVK